VVALVAAVARLAIRAVTEIEMMTMVITTSMRLSPQSRLCFIRAVPPGPGAGPGPDHVVFAPESGQQVNVGAAPAEPGVRVRVQAPTVIFAGVVIVKSLGATNSPPSIIAWIVVG